MKDCPACSEISIEITEKCKAHCVHCSSEATAEGWENELSLGEIKDIIRTGKEKLGTKVISLSGGEPTLRPDFREIVKYIKDLGLNVLIYTCGLFENLRIERESLLCCEQVYDNYGPFSNYIEKLTFKSLALEYLGPRDSGDKVIFSLEGHNSLVHDYILGVSGVFKVVRRMMSFVSQQGHFVEIHCCPNILNYRNIEDVVRIARLANANRVSLLRLVPQGRCPRWMLVTGANWLWLQRDLCRLKKKYGDFIRVGDPLNFMWYFDKDIKNQTCSAGLDRLLIRANGEVQFCAALKHSPEYDYGNVRHPHYSPGERLEWLWKESPMALRLRDFHREGYKETRTCRNCKFLHLCKGGCTSQRIAHYKNLYRGPDPLCPLFIQGKINCEP